MGVIKYNWINDNEDNICMDIDFERYLVLYVWHK
jgi:hypothetical protein